MEDERELTVELELERGGAAIAPIRVAPDDLEPHTLRAVIESFVLREGTDYGVHETSLEDKVAQVLIQLRRGEAHITFDPATESVNVVVTSAIGGSGRPWQPVAPATEGNMAGGWNMPIRIRSASADDASVLSLFGATTFRDTFERENTSQDMERYLADAFTPDRQATEIADSAGAVLLAEHISESGDAELVGYAHLVPGDAPAAVRGAAPLELKRLYVARAWHGHRVAQGLMDAAVDAAHARGAQTLWLGVWERNPRAVAFYAKYGFTRVGEHTFVLGGDAQTDWIFARPVEEG